MDHQNQIHVLQAIKFTLNSSATQYRFYKQLSSHQLQGWSSGHTVYS